MEISFKDEGGCSIAADELAKNGNYTKIYQSDKEIKLEKTFKDGTLQDILYFIDDAETDADILEYDTFAAVRISIGERVFINDYKYEKIFNYDDTKNVAIHLQQGLEYKQ